MHLWSTVSEGLEKLALTPVMLAIIACTGDRRTRMAPSQTEQCGTSLFSDAITVRISSDGAADDQDIA